MTSPSTLMVCLWTILIFLQNMRFKPEYCYIPAFLPRLMQHYQAECVQISQTVRCYFLSKQALEMLSWSLFLWWWLLNVCSWFFTLAFLLKVLWKMQPKQRSLCVGTHLVSGPSMDLAETRIQIPSADLVSEPVNAFRSSVNWARWAKPGTRFRETGPEHGPVTFLNPFQPDMVCQIPQ